MVCLSSSFQVRDQEQFEAVKHDFNRKSRLARYHRCVQFPTFAHSMASEEAKSALVHFISILFNKVGADSWFHDRVLETFQLEATCVMFELCIICAG